MESILAAGVDQLIPELDPSVYQNQASFVVKREQTTTTCATPVVQPTGVRTAKFNIVDGNFLDLSSLHFSFVVRNVHPVTDPVTAHPLQPLSAIPHCWWRRMVVKINGAVVDDLNFLSRLEEQISRFVSTNKRRNWGDAGHGWATLTDDSTDAASKDIAYRGSQRVTWRPLSSGFLQCSKYIPMMGGAAGLSIELECADATAACSTEPNHSTSWQLEQLQVHVDSVQLTSEMTSNFADMLIKGESILIPYQTNSCDVQYLNVGTNQVLSLAKSFSRLATVFVSLGIANANTITGSEMNNFYLAQEASTLGTEIESYIQINNQRWPQFSITGTKQHFHRLLQALGVWNSASHAVCISAEGYGDGTAISSQWVAGYDLESVPHAEGSGIAVQGGGTVQITLKNVGVPTRAYVTTHYDAVLEIKSQGAIAYS
jgi:hypothetical protein